MKIKIRPKRMVSFVNIQMCTKRKPKIIWSDQNFFNGLSFGFVHFSADGLGIFNVVQILRNGRPNYDWKSDWLLFEK